MIELSGAFDEAGAFDQPTKILLVQPVAGQRFDHVQKLQQGKTRWQQFEHHRAIFDLAAQATERGGENAPVIECHAAADRGCGQFLRADIFACGFDHDAGFPQ